MSLEAIIGLQSNILSKLRVLITLRGFVSSFLSIVKTDSIKVKKAHFYLFIIQPYHTNYIVKYHSDFSHLFIFLS